MKILVTGGCGFIGFHTSKALLERGDEVVVVDNFNKYYDVSLKRARAGLLRGCEIVEVDISDYEAMEKVFEKHSFDKVCHLAAQAGVRYSLENPFVYEKSNVKGTIVLLELCKKFKIKDFIFASSSSVYGSNTKLPFSENDRVDNPISLYAATKKNNEEMAYAYNHLFGLNCVGLRFFTVFGPFGRPDMALFLFTDAILKGEEIKVFNNGDMFRDFTYIDDIIKGVLLAIDSGLKFEIFNLARGEKVQLMDFILSIEDCLGMKAKKKMLPMQPGDVKGTNGDISKARKMLGYNPKVSVKEGVKKFIDWYNEYYSV
ncbi:SDR family NAD(P)-dependent oxidoreductase [Candidatus Woesearchaeota archaeon]|nr:SDR family NAD(P)-dependent oxidoreductase [Candidatus Woesearchaeota archaeon]